MTFAQGESHEPEEDLNRQVQKTPYGLDGYDLLLFPSGVFSLDDPNSVIHPESTIVACMLPLIRSSVLHDPVSWLRNQSFFAKCGQVSNLIPYI